MSRSLGGQHRCGGRERGRGRHKGLKLPADLADGPQRELELCLEGVDVLLQLPDLDEDLLQLVLDWWRRLKTE